MIPLWVVIRIEPEGGRRLRLWLPLLLLWLLLLPLALVLLPVLAIWSAVRRVNPFPALGALCSVISATRGTRVEITQDRTVLLVRIV